MAFSDMQGQDAAIAYLRGALARSRIPSAYLFLGPHHVGKRSTALTLAKVLNCRAGQEDSCDACPPCRKIDEGVHPDVETVAADGQFIRIDQVRGVAERLALAPFEARKRVVVVARAERMNLEAANALLKTLEEPPLNTLLVLCAQRAALLPETLVSRCVPVRFGPLPAATVRELLARQETLPPAALEFAVAYAQGCAHPEAARNGERWMTLRDEILARLERFSTEAFEDASDSIAKWSASEDWTFVLNWLETWFHDLALLGSGCAPEVLINQDRRETLTSWQTRFPPGRALACYREVLSTRAGLLLNANKPLALEALWVSLKHTADRWSEPA